MLSVVQGSMVVRIVHGQAMSVYSTLLREQATQQQQARQRQAAEGPSASTTTQTSQTQNAQAQSSRSTGSASAAAQAPTQVAQATSINEAVVTSIRSSRGSASADRITDIKEAKQTVDNVAKKLREEPGTGLMAHGNLNGTGAASAVMSQ